ARLGEWSGPRSSTRRIAAAAAAHSRAEGLGGRAEALRALGRLGEALRVLALLFSDRQAKDRAELRSAELLLDQRDTLEARRTLEKARPTALAEKKEKRLLQGRLEAQLNHRDRALELFQTILRRPEGT